MSNAYEVDQRFLNAYIDGEIDSFKYDDILNAYNLNPDFNLIRNQDSKPSNETLYIRAFKSKINSVV